MRQERAGERAKAAEFYQAAEQANSQQPLRSPRGTTYRGHQFPLVDESTTPYMAAADQLLQNRALLEEKLGKTLSSQEKRRANKSRCRSRI